MQHVKDLTSLQLGHHENYLWKNCHEGITPFSFVLIAEVEHRHYTKEDEARVQATSTTLRDFKTKKEHIPKVCLDPIAIK